MKLAKHAGLLALAGTIYAGSAVLPARAQEAAPAGGADASALYRDPDAQAAYAEGVDLSGAGKYKEAIGKFNKALQIDGAFADAYVAKGDALKELQDYDGAIKAYSGVFNVTSGSAPAYNGRGEAYMELGRLDLAINDFFGALELDRNNAQILSNIGHVLVNSQQTSGQDPSQPLRYLDDAIALNDKDARAYRDRGLAHIRLGEVEESIADLKKAIEIDPRDYENFSTLAQVHMFKDEFEPAIDAVSKAIDAYAPKKRIDPKAYIDGYLMRADARQRLAGKMEDSEKAKRKEVLEASVKDCDKVLEIFKDRFPQNGTAYYRRGRSQRLLEQYSKAVDSFTHAIQLASENSDPGYMADAYLYRGICFHYIGFEDLARGDLEQASATGGGFSDPRVYLWIGYTYHMQQDYREAIKWYSQAAAKNPRFTLAYVNRGRAYMDLKEYRRAIESFNDAVRTEPNVGENYYSVAVACAKLGEYQKAVDAYSLALLKDDPTPKMYRGMADALRELGRDELSQKYDRDADALEAKMQAAN